jgi:hypothetical protein
MKVDPSKSVYRYGLQTTSCSCSLRATVVNDEEKAHESDASCVG